MALNIIYVHGIGEIGGAEKDLLMYLGRLDRQKFSPHVVCPETGPLKEEVEKLQVAVVGLPLPQWRRIKSRVQVPVTVWKLIKIFRQWQIDLVHVNDHWWTPPAYLAAKIYSLPVIVHIRQQIAPSRIQHYWLDKPNALFPVSKHIEQVVLSRGVPPRRVHVMYSGIEVDHFCCQRSPEEQCSIRQRYGLKNDQLIIGTVANLFPRKGYDYLLEALVEVKAVVPGICCLIVGKGSEDYCKKLRQLVVELQLSSNVIFAGFQNNVADFVSIVDIFVLPSLIEGFGIVLLEAMAMEKPIVATDVGGIPEVVVDGVTGLLVPPKHSKALAAAILQLLRDPQKRQAMGKAGRRRVETHFHVSQTMAKLETVYCGLAQHPPSA